MMKDDRKRRKREEKQEMVEVTPQPKKRRKKKKKKKKKYKINVKQLFRKYGKNYKEIANELFNVFVRNQDDYILQDVFNKLFGLRKSIRNNTFLSVNLKLLSLIFEKFSILDLIKHMEEANIMSRFLTKLLNITNMNQSEIRTQFVKYGLKCVYPANNTMLDELIRNKRPINEFLENECYLYSNYISMRKMLKYLIPKYCSNESENKQINPALFEFIKLMVINAVDIDDDDDQDRDNNDKLLLLSFITSICNDHNLLQTQYENIIQQLKNNHILPFYIIDRWRMDEYDNYTRKKQVNSFS